jgi:hypothetical protein
MPNWCSNRLVVTGTREELRVLLRSVHRAETGRYTVLESLVPEPAVLREINAPNNDDPFAVRQRRARYGAADWYEWRLKNWGTKWPDIDTAVSWRSPRSINLRFWTAWNPPIEAIARISARLPDLRFELVFEEPTAPLESRLIW